MLCICFLKRMKYSCLSHFIYVHFIASGGCIGCILYTQSIVCYVSYIRFGKKPLDNANNAEHHSIYVPEWILKSTAYSRIVNKDQYFFQDLFNSIYQI